MFKNLKSIFIVEDEGKAKPSPKTEKKENSKSPKKQEAKTTPTVSPSSSPTADPKVDPKKLSSSRDKILKALAASNLDGYDYFEYKEALRSLKDEALPEAKKYELAYTMAKSMGLTTDKLVDTASHYVNVLKKQEADFQKALAAGYTRKIGERENQLKHAQEQIKHKKAQIEQLTKEIAAHEKNLGSLNNAINKEKVSIQTTKLSFEAALHQIMDQIVLDIQNIKKYLIK